MIVVFFKKNLPSAVPKQPEYLTKNKIKQPKNQKLDFCLNDCCYFFHCLFCTSAAPLLTPLRRTSDFLLSQCLVGHFLSFTLFPQRRCQSLPAVRRRRKPTQPPSLNVLLAELLLGGGRESSITAEKGRPLSSPSSSSLASLSCAGQSCIPVSLHMGCISDLSVARCI